MFVINTRLSNFDQGIQFIYIISIELAKIHGDSLLKSHSMVKNLELGKSCMLQKWCSRSNVLRIILKSQIGP